MCCHFLCARSLYMFPGTYSSPMQHHWLYPRFIKLLVASSQSERRISALPNLGFSAVERTARMSWHHQSVTIFAMIGYFKWFLVHIPHQCTLPEFIHDSYICQSRLANPRGELMCYLIWAFLQVREPRGLVDIVNLSTFSLCSAILHASWAILLTNASSLTLSSIYTDSGRV